MRRTVVLVIAASLAIFGGLLTLVGIPSLGGGSKAGVAAAATPAQQIGMKVLLITDNTLEPSFTDWENTLQREGVPYDTVVTSTSDVLPALSTGQVANYEGVVLATSGTEGLTAAQWQTLQTFEHQFSVRQVTAYVVPRSDASDPGQTKDYGLNESNPVGGGALTSADTFSLTTDGKNVFPYLNTVALDPTQSTYAYEATVASPQAAGASVDTLISGPNNSSLLGIYTSADGRQTMYQTFDESQYYLQSELLRHGELDWLARNTYFGDQRNYLETDVDDNFLSDDSWSINGDAATDTAAHSTDYSAASALREGASDVTTAAAWSAAHKLRIDMLFNGGGSVAFAQGCTDDVGGDGGSGGTTTGCSTTAPNSDPLLAAFQTDKGDFGWISHTWDHPNIDEGCATQDYIEAELNQNTEWGSTAGSGGTGGLGLTETTGLTASPLGNENPNVVITGEHSGLPNLLPGNPGQVDPPAWDDSTTPPAATGGTLAGGNYLYAIADQFNTALPAATTPVAGPGQSAGSIQEVTVPAGATAGSVTLNWDAVCKAADYIIYRVPYTGTYPTGSIPSGDAWSVVKTISANLTTDFADPTSTINPNPTTNTTGEGAQPLSTVDTGTSTGLAGAGEPQSEGTAIEGPYEQNPNLDAAFAATDDGGIQYFGADASKPYPNPANLAFATGTPGSTYTGAEYPSGATFQDAGATAVPRYPTNIYYNVDTNAQEVDEYETLYDSPTCTPITNVTTCNPAGTPFTMATIVQSIDQGMFAHMMGNDPRPDYFHQTNMMNVNTGTPAAAGDPSGANALFYQTVDPLLTTYSTYFNTSTTPIVQYTMAQIGTLLQEQSTWATANTSQVKGSISGNVVSVANTGAAVEVPLTGTNIGTPYAGTQSGWVSAPAGPSTYTAAATWPAEPTGAVIFNFPGSPDHPVITNISGPPKNQFPPQTKANQPKIYYQAVQVAPKTVNIKHGKVTVSLKCEASRGKTAKGKICSGKFTLKVAGKTMSHTFRIKSTKTDRITIKLPKIVQTATSKSKHHKMQGKLTISTTQSHAKAHVSRGTLTIRS